MSEAKILKSLILMPNIKLCVNTQTPLVKFISKASELQDDLVPAPEPQDIHQLKEGADFQFTPGGVTRMVLPLLQHMVHDGIVESAHWVSLNPTGPAEVTFDGITLHHIQLGAERIKGYGNTKETIWKTLHGLPTASSQALAPPTQVFWQDAFSDFTYYNRLSAERILRLDDVYDFDLFYIHDFQQLPVGQMLNTLKPKVFRWHIPFDASTIPPEWERFLSLYFNSYDALIVSCKKYMDALRNFGYDGKPHYVYPYIDPAQYREPTREEATQFCQQAKVNYGDKVILVVARLDPMKGQDRVINAMPDVIRDVPKAKLVLVGNGSFSSSKQGVNLSKADTWLNELRALTKKLRIQDRVVFAGHLDQTQLNAAYRRSDLTVLPSVREGFGLVVIESWLYKKPTIITSRAGIAELIREGCNGLLFEPDAPEDLAGKISNVLLDDKLAQKLGENGFETSKECSIERGVKDESEIMLGLV